MLVFLTEYSTNKIERQWMKFSCIYSAVSIDIGIATVIVTKYNTNTDTARDQSYLVFVTKAL